MKIILSRKGFDAGYGRVPSPIWPDGRMLSLTIPSERSPHRFSDLSRDGQSVGDIVRALTQGAIAPGARTHLDPDLDVGAIARGQGWRGLYGQTGSAQAHLRHQGVSVGDLFLFFGWFRNLVETPKGLSYERYAPDLHVIFGWLQVGSIVRVGVDPVEPWMGYHPHFHGGYEGENVVYVGANSLTLHPSVTSIPGYGIFPRFARARQLTRPGAPRSVWRLPAWFHQPSAEARLSFHGSEARWRALDDTHVELRSVAKGQEFVMDLDGGRDWVDWLEDLFADVRAAAVPELCSEHS